MKRLKAMDMERNISDLPRPILHHILSSLPQNDAVKTCVLSKSWRYLWYGRPNLVFCKDRFRGTEQEFISVLDQILIRYTNQNLSIQQFILKMPKLDPVSARFLEKWIQTIVMRNKGIETFHLSFDCDLPSVDDEPEYCEVDDEPDYCEVDDEPDYCDLPSVDDVPEYFGLPSVVFKSECLREIYLEGCKLNQIDKVVLRHLQTLRLRGVKVEEETFERIMSSSPLIQEVSLIKCPGLKTVKVNNHNCSLKNFMFKSYYPWCGDSRIEIADVSSIKTIKLKRCWDWFEHNCNHRFTHLKSLHLNYFYVTTKSLDIFSCNFPCLEELELGYCLGTFEEFQLSSSSIKRLAIKLSNPNASITIDAPNILEFEYEGCAFPPHISFTTTSNKWKSNIVLRTDLDDSKMAFSKWLHKLDELLMVFSQSETSLHIRVHRWEDDCRFLCAPNSPTREVVKHLELCLGRLCSDFSVWLEVEGEPTRKWKSKSHGNKILKK